MFHFKKFSLDDDHSSMKVGTDSVLLGAMADTEGVDKILDIGTGCGIISLMLAQKSKAMIHAVEIDEESSIEAEKNFELSPWKNRLKLIFADISDYSETCSEKYGLIVSNPPYFQSGKRKQAIQKGRARHNDCLNFQQLCRCVSMLMERNGRFIVIIPCSSTVLFTGFASRMGLHLEKICIFHTYSQSKPVRHIVQFSFENNTYTKITRFILREQGGKYSAQFRALTNNFLLERSFR